MENQTAVQFKVLRRQEGERLYKVIAIAPDGYADVDEIDFGGLESCSLERLGRLDPWEFAGRSGWALRTHLEQLLPSGVTTAEISLPHEPVAALNWEQAAPLIKIIRRPHNDPSYTTAHVTTPFRLGIFSLAGEPSGKAFDASAVEQLIRSQAPAHLVETYVVPAPASFRSFLSELIEGEFQGVHVLLRTEADSSGRRVRVGGESVALETFIEETARANARFVFLHDTGPKPWAGISALRWDSQRLPADSCTALILLAAPAERRHTNSFLKDAYRQIFQDTPLETIVARPDSVIPRPVYASAVANPGVTRALNAGVTSSALENRLRFLQEQRYALAAVYPEQFLDTFFDAEYADGRRREADPRQRLGSAPEQDAGRSSVSGGDPDEQSLGILRSLRERVEAEEAAFNPVVEEVIQKTDPDQPRYPAALFYLVGADKKADPIPKISSISPPPEGVKLELHFWVDIVKGGIDYRDKRWPQFVRQDSSLYPVTLEVEVWSEDFQFSERRQTLILPQAGPTEGHARFPVALPDPGLIPSRGKRGEVFIFLQHATPDGRKELVAVFRVEALMTRSPVEEESAQLIEDAYLAPNWFTFEDATVGSAFTIFMAKRGGHLQVFTLTNTDAPWGQLGATEEAAYQVSEAMYRYLHHLSLTAAAKKELNLNLGFKHHANGLAELGYRLYSTIFFSPQTAPKVREFYERFLAGLPPHSAVTIALNKDTSNFIIPWGLMYDRKPPPLLGTVAGFGSLDVAQQEGFWGVRYNLVVRPSMPAARAARAENTPPRMGAAWYTHTETLELEEELRPLKESGNLSVERVKAEDQMIPALVKESFDLVQFFCHGYTSLPGKDVDAGLVENYKRFAEASRDEVAKEMLMAISAPQSKPSFILLDGGAVPLPVLNIELRELPGRPIVMLSMCESAQVTCAGAGFVTLFLDRGARSVIGTEGPTLWGLGREMDVRIIRRLLSGQSIGQAFSETRRELVGENVLALIYSLFGDANAKLNIAGNSSASKERSS